MPHTTEREVSYTTVSYEERTCLLTLLESHLLSPFSVLWLLHPFHHRKSFLTKPVTLSLLLNSQRTLTWLLSLPLIIRVEGKLATFEVTIHLPTSAAATSLDPSLFSDLIWGQCFKPDRLNTGLYELTNAAFSLIF